MTKTIERMLFDTIESCESNLNVFDQINLPTSYQRLIVANDQMGRMNALNQVSTVYVASPNPYDIVDNPTRMADKITANNNRVITNPKTFT